MHMNFTASARSRPESESLSVLAFNRYFVSSEKNPSWYREILKFSSTWSRSLPRMSRKPPIPSERARKTLDELFTGA
jgi:hypothetical protein